MLDKELEASVDAYVAEVWEDVVRDIERLVAHPSVADESRGAEGAPYGPEVRSALDEALAIARRLGYETGNYDGYMGMADVLGYSERQVATIAHLDVVPAGTGWATDPFTMVRRDGWLLGRGVIDDKGPAVLALYAGAYLIRRGIKPRYTFRALLGCDEEVGMTDVHRYLDRYPAPAFLFTPDASFPVCNAEKGLFDGMFTTAQFTGRVRDITGGEVTNAIPGEATLVIEADAAALPAAESIDIEDAGEGCARLTAHGLGGHASLPEGTVNAIGMLVSYVLENGLVEGDECRAFELLAAIHADTAGESLGIATSTPAFGPLTVIGGVVRMQDGRITQTIDCRYPDSTTVDALATACSAVAERFGGTFETTVTKVPFSVSADSPAVRALLETYEDVTGDAAEPFAMGGGTYARNFPAAVSFGPEEEIADTPEWAGTMHGPNEAANEASLKRALKMYIIAILRLMEAEL